MVKRPIKTHFIKQCGKTISPKDFFHNELNVNYISSKISEVSIYDCVPLRGASIMINVSKWSDELLAAGKLSTVWVIARGIPRILKKFQGFCEAGSTIGQVLEVDMELFKKTRHVRIKIGVVDHTKIPPSARVTDTSQTYL
jgi:hypothetical protein